MNNYKGVIEGWTLGLIKDAIKKFRLKSYQDDIEQDLVIKILDVKRANPALTGEDEKRVIGKVVYDHIINFTKHLAIRRTVPVYESDSIYDPWHLIDLKIDLECAMEKLQKQDRAICQLFLCEYTFREIGKILGISQKTISATKKRIRDVFRRMGLDEYIE